MALVIGSKVTITFGTNIWRGRRLLYAKGTTVPGAVYYIHRNGDVDYNILDAKGQVVSGYLPGSKDIIREAQYPHAICPII